MNITSQQDQANPPPLDLGWLPHPEQSPRNPLRVLVACEFFGIVRDAFLEKGHDAWSCDMLPAEHNSNRHIQCDVRDILNDGWDFLIVAHPPCTRLCNSGVRWLHKAPPGKSLDQMWRELREGAERPSLTPEGREGLKAEIFLYDTLPGGAGFASQLVDRGTELFQRALRLVETCPENCDASCYRCLRSFKNKFEHRLLDRHVAADLLQYLLTGTLSEFDEKRLKDSTALLYRDLLRQGDMSIDFKTYATASVKSIGEIEIPILAMTKRGEQFAIALSGPLTADHPASPSIRELRDKTSDIQVIVINELLVRGNLPAATREVRQRMQA